MKQIDLLLTGENVSDEGEFHRFKDVTSLPRPTQKPRPRFWTAAFTTPESFEKAGRVGNYIMAIPIGSSEMAELIGIYREAWKSAGHDGDGRVMLAFHMYCHEDTAEAARIARGPITRYLKSLVDAARGWVDGAASDNYKGYGKMIEALDRETFESQVEKGSAWVGSPEELSEQIRSYHAEIGGFDDASLQVNFNDMSFEDAERSVKLFGEKVMPAFATG
jgi:alkanesulfonate monooxygenase SsuD/methylene tetrahydromethanopterin reductase-like flavin-dependent oxidoreductase (luciferase family)